MIQKAVLAGFVTCLITLFAINLSEHRGEADFILGWFSAKSGHFARATTFFERALFDAKKDSPLHDRASVALWAAYAASWSFQSAQNTLSSEVNHTDEAEFSSLNSLRLYDLGNARAQSTLTLTGETRKMQLLSALSAYTGAYQNNRDPDAAFNYEIIAKLLADETPKLPSSQPNADDSAKKGTDGQSGSASGSSQSKPKGETDGQGDPTANSKDGKSQKGQSEEKNPSEPNQKSQPSQKGGWTNNGNPQSLKGDPGGRKSSDGSIPLSEGERQELEDDLKGLGGLQKDRNQYLRPDGKPQSGDMIPDSIRDLFSGDPFFEGMVPNADAWPNGKSW